MWQVFQGGVYGRSVCCTYLYLISLSNHQTLLQTSFHQSIFSPFFISRYHPLIYFYSLFIYFNSDYQISLTFNIRLDFFSIHFSFKKKKSPICETLSYFFPCCSFISLFFCRKCMDIFNDNIQFSILSLGYSHRLYRCLSVVLMFCVNVQIIKSMKIRIIRFLAVNANFPVHKRTMIQLRRKRNTIRLVSYLRGHSGFMPIR